MNKIDAQIRFCPECGTIGGNTIDFVCCCPDRKPVMLDREIAILAAIGFKAEICRAEIERKLG